MNSPSFTKPNFNELPIWLTIFGSISLLCLGQFQLVDSSVAMLYLNLGGIGLIACLGLSEMRRRKNEREIHKLREAATTDALTEVGNRRAFDLELSRRWAMFQRHRAACSLVMIDADHFKAINDRWGHDVGDLALKAISKAISATLRDIDLLYRFGGEEFVALLPETRAMEAAIAGERIRQAVEMVTLRLNDKALSFTVSVGCVQILSSDNTESWLKRADTALYLAKKQGRNRVVVAEHCQQDDGVSTPEASPKPEDASRAACSKQPSCQQPPRGIPKQTR